MTLDLDAIKASQKRVYYGTDLADKEAHATPTTLARAAHAAVLARIDQAGEGS